MRYLPWAFLFASLFHMFEEFFYPGGFVQIVARIRPVFVPYFTVPALIVLNGLQLTLCLLVIFLPNSSLVLPMSLAALLLINGISHIATAILVHGYAPGVVTSTLLYLPLAAWAFTIAVNTFRISAVALLESLALGVIYQLIPFAYVKAMSQLHPTRA